MIKLFAVDFNKLPESLREKLMDEINSSPHIILHPGVKVTRIERRYLEEIRKIHEEYLAKPPKKTTTRRNPNADSRTDKKSKEETSEIISRRIEKGNHT